MSDGPISIADIVDEHVAALEEPREPDGAWHPSSYWGCDRKVIYEVRGTPQTNPPDNVSKRRFRLGHIIHAFVQTALETAPGVVACYSEFSIRSQLNEKGHGDALLELEDGTFIVIEAKSARKTSFKFGMKDDHAKQGSSYAVQARVEGVWVDDPAAEGGKRFIEPLGEKLAGVLVVYIEKEDLHIKQYWLPYDRAWEERIRERIAHLEAYKSDPESLPPRLPMTKKGGKLVKNWMCGGAWGSCPFLDKCWKQDGSARAPGEEPAPPEYEW